MAGVYLSYPFCRQKCTFCNFASGVQPAELERRYVEELEAELSGVHWPWMPETLYLGGGTPSSLDGCRLASLLALIPGRPWREATIECAPGGVTRELAGEWRALGLNRVSLGVQSFVTAELRRTGRMHDAETVAREVLWLREAGIDSINIDLIAGLPGQSLASWDESLDWVERLGPEHVSVYIFEVDADSRLGEEVLLNGQRYGAPVVPSGDLMAELYERAVDRLAGMGIERYEISNFARRGWESVHNLKYWLREPYLGFGSDAHSFDGEQRWSNPESAEEYVAKTPRSAAWPARPDEEQYFLGLRLTREGIPDDGHPAILRHLASGLLERHGDRVRLTRRGVLLSNEVFQDFLAEETVC